MRIRICTKLLLSALLTITVPAVVFGAVSVSWDAGTYAGWDFHELSGDIARNNTVDTDDLNLLAQHWLGEGCGGSNQWCGRTDIDCSGAVDFLDYAMLANDWSKQAGDRILLQTIYGTAQDANGTITANSYRALSEDKGMAMAFAVGQNIALDKGSFKLRNVKADDSMHIRLYDVTGKGYLNYSSHPVVTRADPGSGGALLIDYTGKTPKTVPYHLEQTTIKMTDMIINFGPTEVNAGEYLLVLDNLGLDFTSCSVITGATAAEIDGMGKYPDGAPLPKRATVTTSAATGNTYFYQLGSTVTTTNYSAASSLCAFQITTKVVNHPPIVDAGPDQQILHPNNFLYLSGMATDDGLPNPPGAVTTQWSEVSGPGEVIFNDVNSLETGAVFDQLGTYVLRLTASDGELSAYDDIVVDFITTDQPPVVEAGRDHIIVAPHNIVNLDATVTDDGAPNPPGVVTVEWTKESGPGDVVFGNAGAIDTTATFSEVGTYVLRLTASDSLFSGYDEMTVQYLETTPENQAPTVEAGGNKLVVLPAMALLSGIVTDDGWPDPPGQVTIWWTLQNGPAPATIADASALTTTASFSQVGTYVFRLTVSDGYLSSYDELTVTVQPPINQMVYHVTNLNDSGAGSLRDCAAKANSDGMPSRIVFDVGGTIFFTNHTDTIALTEPNTTICATQAPSPGITIDCCHTTSAFSVDASKGSFGHRFCNLHIQNTNDNWDGIGLTGGHTNCTFERCTFTYCRDEGVGMNNSYGNVIAFSRFDYCGSGSDGRGILVMGGSAVLISNSVYQCCRGVDINTTGFMECRHCLLQESQNVNSGSGFTNAGGANVYSNVIDCVANNNPCSGFRWKSGCHFYRSGNSGTGNCYYWPQYVPPDQWLECPDVTCVEHTSPITGADTVNYLPVPAWLVDNVNTPASPDDVGQGTGLCQCIAVR